jgi:membrane-bound lytic murein transglycosylase D
LIPNHRLPGMLLTRLKFPHKRSPVLIAVLILGLSGCVVTEPRPEPAAEPPLPPYYLRAHLDDPFQTIDEAIRQVGTSHPQPTASPDEAVEDSDLWERIVDRFTFAECPEDSRAAQWARWFGDRPDYMERVMTRARPWLHDIANEIEARDLPGELALLPIVESAYDPFAYSHGRASGAWQFLSATARDHGIEINDFYDGRRDLYAATRAALDYLGYLGGRFGGDWNLALAAYNGGQGRVARAIERNRARNRSILWHDLPLPRETLAYVPKLNGLGCLFQQPERFGFERPQWKDQPSIARVDLPGATDVVVLSALAELDLAQLVALNAGLNRHLTSPTGPHHLIVPVDQAERVVEVLPELNGQDMIIWREINVRRGDTLSGLAIRHDTSVRALREANNLNGDLLRIGQTLRLPTTGMTPENSPWAERYQELASLQQRLLPTRRFQHEVRPGESLWVIARNHRVRVSDIQRWNGMGNSNLIRPGQRLMIHMDSSASQPVTASREYTVRQGDSLWLIARRHRISLNDLMRWNSLNEKSILRPGQTLTIRRGSDV